MSVSKLAGLVGDVADFRANIWRRTPAILRPEVAFEPPLTVADIDDVLAFGALQAGYVGVQRADKVITPEAYCSSRTFNGTVHHDFADGGKIRDLVRDGGTLVLRGLEQWHAATASLTSALTSELGLRADAALIITPPGRQGLRVHRDDADVFVVQLNGSKNWRVHAGPTDEDWIPGLTEDDGLPLLSEVLRTGEVLYVPRGFAHYATGERGLSVHLSLAVREVGGVHLYEALQQALLEGYRIESRPVDDDALLARAAGMLAHLKDRLSALSPHDVVALARTAMLADVTSHTSPGLNELAAALDEPAADRVQAEVA
ncbi:JmjC domain-containing protein [Streptomyces caeni]|uniref:JmjC domain-containing protein n=1 Tax=Streptomyces caeni TaxID=2307231 RepID=A0ABW4IXA4_9ACTN